MYLIKTEVYEKKAQINRKRVRMFTEILPIFVRNFILS